MALTMTRTRTQTALTKLVELLAGVKGELEQVERLLGAAVEEDSGLLVRKAALLARQDALCVTLRQFDLTLDLTVIAVTPPATGRRLQSRGQRAKDTV